MISPQFRRNLIGIKKFRMEIIDYSHYENRKHYWVYICDCGNLGLIDTSHFNRALNKSCGCYRKDILEIARKSLTFKNKLPKGQAAFNWLYLDYQNGASKRGYDFNIDKSQFRTLVISNCYYCNSTPSNKAKTHTSNGQFIYNGLDRLNPNLGYTPDNVVPSCKTCNYAKRSMTKADFINWVKSVYYNIEGIK